MEQQFSAVHETAKVTVTVFFMYLVGKKKKKKVLVSYILALV